jgi:exodeoxyribonuclease VII large subunit
VKNNPDNILRLSDLQSDIQNLLKDQFSAKFWIIAEISEISVNFNGHCYLDLVEKDDDTDNLIAKVRATIWAYTYRMLKPYFETTTGHPLRSGIKILVQASVEYHPVYSLSLNIHDIDPSYTLGDLERRRKEIINRLEKDGVINMNKELNLPLVPQKIAVISSKTAAGYGDFLDQLRQNPFGYVFYTHLFPAVMQGEKMESSIIAALDSIHESPVDFDLVALIRGGGSKADLASFDSYDLAYYITQFPLPVITGIGHEQDDSITDLVAHTRMKTPTAVANFLIDTLAGFESILEAKRGRIVQASEGHLVNNRLRLQLLGQKIGFTSEKHLAGLNDRLVRINTEIRHSMSNYLNAEKSRIEKVKRILSYIDPANVLKLGYSISRFKGKVLRNISGLKKGDVIETTLNKGKIESTVSGTSKPN